MKLIQSILGYITVASFLEFLIILLSGFLQLTTSDLFLFLLVITVALLEITPHPYSYNLFAFSVKLRFRDL